MGCGSSVNSAEPKKTDQAEGTSKSQNKNLGQQLKSSKTMEIDEMMGKKVPKFLIEQQTIREDANDEEEFLKLKIPSNKETQNKQNFELIHISHRLILEDKDKPVETQAQEQFQRVEDPDDKFDQVSLQEIQPEQPANSKRNILQCFITIKCLSFPPQSSSILNSCRDQDIIQRNSKKAVKKFRGNDNEDELLMEKVTKVDKSMTCNQSSKYFLASDKNLIKQSFKGHFVFYSLSDSAIDGLMQSMFYCTLEKDQFIFKQGDKVAHRLLLINRQAAISYLKKGKLKSLLIINQFELQNQGMHLVKWLCFTMLLDLHQSNQRVIANYHKNKDVNCGFWGLERQTFKKCLKNLMSKEYDENRKFIEEVDI